jgi:hypothetical protein
MDIYVIKAKKRPVQNYFAENLKKGVASGRMQKLSLVMTGCYGVDCY